MFLAKNSAHNKFHKHRWLPLAIIFILLIILGVLVAFRAVYSGRIFPGVYVGHLALGGLEPDAARKKIQDSADAYLRKGFAFSVPGKRVAIDAVIFAPEDPDLSYELLKFDVDAMIKNAYSLGRGKYDLQNLSQIITAYFRGKALPISYRLDKERLGVILMQNFNDIDSPARDASWAITFTNGEPNFKINSEKGGMVLNYVAALQTLEKSVIALSPKEIEVGRLVSSPKVTMAAVEEAIPSAKVVLSRAPLEVMAGDKSWTIYPEIMANWLKVASGQNRGAQLDEEKMKKTLSAWGDALHLNKEPRNAKFSIKDGKVVEFQSSVDGANLGNEANIAALKKAFMEGVTEKPLILKLEVTEPEYKTEEVNTYGITEKIGEATTSFAGSPKNRRLNINVAVEKLSGLLIPPEEEFSLVKAIGAVNAETGFKQELVIKGNKTTPEFGGGLCQIASTVFRSALSTGLPILERQNHSYRVPYYEPPIGMDATIYLPKPDLKFKNDTGASILVLARVDGDNLTFEFWGRRDGRKAETSVPEVYNIVAPPASKTIFTHALAPGVKKCTERAHAGSDAKFIYTITRADGTVEEKIFRSHYRPWREVCLVGVPLTQAIEPDLEAALEE